MPNTPTSILVSNCAEMLIKDISKNDFLEVGVGAGDFIHLLGKRGFSGHGIDLSDESVRRTRAVIEKYSFPGIDVRQADLMELDGYYSNVFAFEVLEHFEDDIAALRKIFSLLEPGGYIIMSVPAHQKAWGANDDLAGHIQRYEKTELKRKLEQVGFVVYNFWSAAYPIGNIFKILRDRLEKRAAYRSLTETARDRTVDSGVIRVIDAPDSLYNLLFNKLTLWPGLLLQRLFFNSDLGISYVIKARKPLR